VCVCTYIWLYILYPHRVWGTQARTRPFIGKYFFHRKIIFTQGEEAVAMCLEHNASKDAILAASDVVFNARQVNLIQYKGKRDLVQG
jgi:hypothetical protein